MNEWLIMGGLLMMILLITTVSSRINSLENEVKGLRNLLNRMAQHMDMPEHSVNERLRELVKDGRRVQAVKEAREAMGLSLVEAKQYVDGLG